MIDFTPSGQLGQNSPATEGTVKEGFSNAEKILLASTVVGAIGVVLNLLHMLGYVGPKVQTEEEVRL